MDGEHHREWRLEFEIMVSREAAFSPTNVHEIPKKQTPVGSIRMELLSSKFIL